MIWNECRDAKSCISTMRKIANYLTKNRSGKSPKIAQHTRKRIHQAKKNFWRNSKQFLTIKMKQLNKYTLVVCSIVRNAERGLVKNIPIIEEVCKHFKNYKIVVYENDSTDNTKSILKEWSLKNPNHVYALLKDGDKSDTIPKAKEVKGNPFFSYKRIGKMAYLRNQYMNYIEEQKWQSDYLMVVDLDVAQLNSEGIFTSFLSNTEWDAVTAFGYSISPQFRIRYHDTYALTEYGNENAPQTESKIKEMAKKYGKLFKTHKWIRVYSAFGGLAIYKFEAIKGLRYQVIDNADHRVEVKCEHFSIYQQMEQKGYNRVYINPEMSLKYQALTWKIIWKAIQRMILS